MPYISTAQLALDLKAALGIHLGFPPTSAGDMRDLGWIPGLGRFPRRGHGNPLWYCCLENSTVEDPGGLQSIASRRVRHD